MLYELDRIAPELAEDAWVAPTAVLIGRCRLLAGASVWWGAVLRGDNEWITIGEGSNVQDGCVMHTDPGCPLDIGPNVTIGHLAMLHGCSIGEGALIGIGATILNNAKIGKRCLIGAGTLIAEGKEIPDDSLVMGAPGKIIKDVTPEQAARMAEGTGRYVVNAARYRSGLRLLND